MTRSSISTLLVAIVILLPLKYASAQEAIDSPYLTPTTPVLLDPDTPSFAPLDAEVDAFVRIPQARAQFGVDGTGLAVVVIDSGINPQHLSFQGRLIPGRNFSTVGSETDTVDTDGHGSNVAGIIMGRQLAPSLGLPTGVAPAAHAIPMKVFPGGAFDKINEALQWIIDERDRIRTEHNVTISVVNMSLGNRTNFNSLPGLLPAALRTQQELIAELRDLGVVVTVAAGNHYAGFEPEQGMSFPAICPETTSVGALYDTDIAPSPNGSALVTYRDGGQVFSSHPGRLTVFTQRLGASSGGQFRTDVFAPGFIVTSAGPVPPDGSGQDPTRTRTTQDGTSQASPVVSGLVLLLQHHFLHLMQQAGRPDSLPPVDLIEACLRSGGVPIADLEDDTAQRMDNVQSSGATDLFRIDAILALTELSAQVNSELQNLQIDLLKAPDPKMQKQILARNAAKVLYGRDESRQMTPAATKSTSSTNVPPLAKRLAAVRDYVSGLEAASIAAEEPLELSALTEQPEARQALEERIVGEPDFLPADFIVTGSQRQAAVGRISFKAVFTHPSGGTFFPGDGWGTGFLVAPGLLMTNNHVLDKAAFARDTVRVEFNYQRRLADGLMADADSYDFDPDDFFYTNASLDFTLVRVKPKTPGSSNPVGTGAIEAGDRWGFYSLADSRTVSDADFFQNMRLNVIQHPDGRPKEVAIHQNRLDSLLTSHVRYTTDTEGGSSGSPVFDNRWILMALHHRAGELDQHGNWKNNQGVRIDRIIADIEASQDISAAVRNDLRL